MAQSVNQGWLEVAQWLKPESIQHIGFEKAMIARGYPLPGGHPHV